MRASILDKNPVKSGAALISDERKRQIEVEGWTAEHDDDYVNQPGVEFPNPMVMAASCYMFDPHNNSVSKGTQENIPITWPWNSTEWKPTTKIRNLVKAGALIAAEIDRLQRLEEKKE